MDLRGFETINQALAAANLEATVTPRPNKGDDVRFVTVETDPGVPPARVLNALCAVGLMQYDGPRDGGMNYNPKLNAMGVQPGSITFEDKNDANRRMWR